MPSFEEHCIQSLVRFGNPYKEVNLWLDEFAGRPPFGMKHRRFRHNLVGIEEIRRKWGLEAAEVARQHVIADLKMDCWVEDQGIPCDEQDYVRRGLY